VAGAGHAVQQKHFNWTLLRVTSTTAKILRTSKNLRQDDDSEGLPCEEHFMQHTRNNTGHHVVWLPRYGHGHSGESNMQARNLFSTTGTTFS
jgi:hypothetical protein